MSTLDLVDKLRSQTPASIRRRAANARVLIRRPTSAIRVLPDFLIIGTQRGGTSSLYKYLEGHPAVIASLRKEIQYFSRRYSFGLDWYRSHFPMRLRTNLLGTLTGRRIMAFEATPDYLFDPHAAARAAEIVPEAKLIVLLRDPVERAFSHYRHMVRLGFETLSFEEALAAERARLAGDMDAMRDDPLYDCKNYRRFSYVARGIYVEQLERWMAHFDSDRFLILKSEDFFSNPGRVFGGVLQFLGLHVWEPQEFKNYSYPAESRSHQEAPGHSALESPTRTWLAQTFRPHNQRLYELLGRGFDWED